MSHNCVGMPWSSLNFWQTSVRRYASQPRHNAYYIDYYVFESASRKTERIKTALSVICILICKIFTTGRVKTICMNLSVHLGIHIKGDVK